MDNKSDIKLDEYLREIKSALSQTDYKAAKYRIEVYLKKHPKATIADIYSEFGKPGDIIQATKGCKGLTASRSIGLRQYVAPIAIFLAVLAVTFIVFMILGVVHDYKSNQKYAPVSIVSTTDEILKRDGK